MEIPKGFSIFSGSIYNCLYYQEITTMKLGSFFGGSDSEMSRLTITSHHMGDCSDAVPKDDKKRTFVVQVNPEKLKYSFGMTPVGEEEGGTASSMNTPGGSAPVDGFKAYNKMEMNFKFYADATGILPIHPDRKAEFMKGEKPSIRNHLNKLQSVVYGYEPEIHGHPYLKLVWGEIFPDTSNMTGESNPAVFKGILKDCSIELNLFSLSGEPVKAEINLTITSKIEPDARPLGKSPDLTHYYDITEGDKMTTYCNRIYGRYDSKICAAVAEYNNMIDWKLPGGTKIIFPSIHMLNDKYLNDYEEVEIESIADQSEEKQMRELIGDKRANQYYKTFPNRSIKNFEA